MRKLNRLELLTRVVPLLCGLTVGLSWLWDCPEVPRISGICAGLCLWAGILWLMEDPYRTERK